MRRAIEWLSVLIHDALFGCPSMSLCARAHWLEHYWFWRIWVKTFDNLFRLYERNHCRASFERCFLDKRGKHE